MDLIGLQREVIYLKDELNWLKSQYCSSKLESLPYATAIVETDLLESESEPEPKRQRTCLPPKGFKQEPKAWKPLA